MHYTQPITFAASPLTALRNQEGYRFGQGFRSLTWFEIAVLRVFKCREHNFTWPVRNQADAALRFHAKGFDSHQTCTCCGIERFFNSETLAAGPFFVRVQNLRPSFD